MSQVNHDRDIKGTGSWLNVHVMDGDVRLDLSIEDDCCSAGFSFVAADCFDFYFTMQECLEKMREGWKEVYGRDFETPEQVKEYREESRKLMERLS